MNSLSLSEGLPHDFVDDVYRDSAGFMWLSLGGGGLCRYDGYSFFKIAPSTPHCRVKSNFVKKVVEDDFRRLWIGTAEGISVIDLKTMTNHPCDSASEYHHVFDSDIDFLTKDKKGNIWIIGRNRWVACVAFESNGEIKEVATYINPLLTGHFIADIDRNGTAWVGVKGGVKILALNNGKIVEQKSPSAIKINDDSYISTITPFKHDLWIGTDWGIYRYNRREGTVKRYLYDPSDEGSLSQNFISDISLYHSIDVDEESQQLIVATYCGLNIYNEASDSFEHIDENTIFNSGSSLGTNFINSVYSHNGNLWVCTEGNGMKMLSPKSLFVENFMPDPSLPGSLSNHRVNALCETDDGNIWVGTVEGGLDRFIPGTRNFVHHTTQNSQLVHNSVSALAMDSNSNLWVGTWGGGLDVFIPSEPLIKVNHFDKSYFEGFSDFISSLIYDPINNGMWIGGSQGIFFYDEEKCEIINPLPKQVSDSIIGTIGVIIDRGGNLWLGSSTGLYIVDLHSRQGDKWKYRSLVHKLDKPNSSTIERLSWIFQDQEGTIWLGSNGYGLYKRVLDGGKESFKVYTTDNGLPNNTVKSILQDNKGFLWVATNNGLGRMDIENETFETYDTSDGLISNSFYWNAALRTSNDDLLFGSEKGLTRISGVRITPPHESHPVVRFTRLTIDNEAIFIDRDILKGLNITVAKDIYLHENNRSIGLEFSALDFSDEPGTYQYKLEGWDSNWINDNSNQHAVNYTSLPAGNYTLKVRYIRNGDIDNAPVSSIDIHVRPAFYRTLWFIMIVIGMIVLGIWFWIHYRTQSYRRQKNILEKEVEQHTSEIEAQKRQIEAMATDRISFFTNITHEFRTPITLIMGPIQRALKLSSNPQVIEQLQLVDRNSKYLLSLVNQLMDFRKVESGKMETHRTKGNFRQFMHELIVPFHEFARERNITINEICHLPVNEFYYDEDSVRKVMINLLSNAIKFTTDKGTITVYATLVPDKESSDTLLYVSVHDTGPGIDEKDLPLVFERFYQGNTALKYPVFGSMGSGIGLYLCKEVITMLGGNISVKNHRKVGCAFRFTIPVSFDDSATSLSAIPTVASTESKPAEDSISGNLSTPIKKSTTIMVVEDNADMRRYIVSILSERYNVVEASDGKEGLKVLLSNDVHIIISDLMMSGMDGLELAKRIKDNFAVSHIPIIMLTAKTNRESRIEGYKIGVEEYLLKPFDEEVLLARIENILSIRARYQAIFSSNMQVENLNINEESRDSKFMRQVMEVLQANYTNSFFDINDFSEALGISRSLLSKKLQSIAGQSPSHFIRNYRLNAAKELIVKNRETKSLNITEIAYEVGFNDSKYFTRCFSALFKITPRNMLNGENPPVT